MEMLLWLTSVNGVDVTAANTTAVNGDVNVAVLEGLQFELFNGQYLDC